MHDLICGVKSSHNVQTRAGRSDSQPLPLTEKAGSLSASLAADSLADHEDLVIPVENVPRFRQNFARLCAWHTVGRHCLKHFSRCDLCPHIIGSALTSAPLPQSFKASGGQALHGQD